MELGRLFGKTMKHLFTQCGWERCGELTVEEFGILIQLINLDRFADHYISREIIDMSFNAIEEERRMSIERIFASKTTPVETYSGVE